MLDIQIADNQEMVDISLNLAHHYFYSLGQLKLTGSEKSYEATNQITKARHSITLPEWEINDDIIQQSTSIVDEIKNMSVQTATIFQKIPEGFLRISTNVMKLNGQRAIGTFIPNSSKVIQTIMAGNTYRGRAFVVNDWYLTAYEPILIDGEIRGILYVGVKEKDLSNLENIFQQKSFYENGYAALFSSEGKFIIPPVSGKGLNDQTFYKEIKATGKNQGQVKVKNLGKSAITYFSYYPPIEAYVTITVFENDLMGLVNDMIIAVILVMVVGIILFIIIITWITNSLTRALKKGVTFAHDISHGNLTTQLDVNQKMKSVNWPNH